MDFMNKDNDTVFRFDELQMALRMLKQGGMIRKDKTFIQYTYEWQEKQWYLNASGYFDRICKKYSIYPNYLNL